MAAVPTAFSLFRTIWPPSAAWTLRLPETPPSLFAYFFNADVSKDGRFQDPSTPTTNQPSTQSICLSPKWVCLKIVYPYTQWLMIIIQIFRHTQIATSMHQCCATLAAKVFFLYRQELPAVPPATPRLDCGTDE